MVESVERKVKEATLAQIRKDRHGAPEDVEQWLELIERQLFEPAFKIDPQVGGEERWKFRNWVGVDPAAYADHLRLTMACQMVEKSEARVADIAFSLGFRDPDLFSKWFKRRRGLTPRDLRGVRPTRVTQSNQEARLLEVRRLLGNAGLEPRLGAVDQSRLVDLLPTFGRQALVAALGPMDAALILEFLAASRKNHE